MIPTPPSTLAFELDHLVLGARTLADGIRHVEQALGLTAVPGGQHAGLGTHNALVPLLRRRYLEIIAVDPHAAQPMRSRWFGLDDACLLDMLDAKPRLIGYVVRCTHIPDALSGFPALAPEPASRGALRWTFGFTANGTRPGEGALPYFITWHANSAHPCDVLPEAHLDCTSLLVESPHATEYQRAVEILGLSLLNFRHGATPALTATFTSSQKSNRSLSL